jgi:hypothetical protein
MPNPLIEEYMALDSMTLHQLVEKLEVEIWEHEEAEKEMPTIVKDKHEYTAEEVLKIAKQGRDDEDIYYKTLCNDADEPSHLWTPKSTLLIFTEIMDEDGEAEYIEISWESFHRIGVVQKTDGEVLHEKTVVPGR